MSEVISRPSASRGRGSGRGGRGGFAGRGGRRSNGENFKTADDNLGTFEDEGEFAELRKQYGDKTLVIREMFPDWSEPDVLYALKETNGDETEAVTRMAEGTLGHEICSFAFCLLPFFHLILSFSALQTSESCVRQFNCNTALSANAFLHGDEPSYSIADLNFFPYP